MKKLLILLALLVSVGDVFAAAAGSSGGDGNNPNNGGTPNRRVSGFTGKQLTSADRSDAVMAVRVPSPVPEADSEDGSEGSGEGSPVSHYASLSSQGSDGTASTALAGGSQETLSLDPASAETETADTI